MNLAAALGEARLQADEEIRGVLLVKDLLAVGGQQEPRPVRFLVGHLGDSLFCSEGALRPYDLPDGAGRQDVLANTHKGPGTCFAPGPSGGCGGWICRMLHGS